MGNDINEYIEIIDNYQTNEEFDDYQFYSTGDENIYNDNFPLLCKHLSELCEIVQKINELNVSVNYGSNEYTGIMFNYFTFLWTQWDILYSPELLKYKKQCMNYILNVYYHLKNKENSSNECAITNIVNKIMDSEGILFHTIVDKQIFIDQYAFEEDDEIIAIDYNKI